MGWEPVCSAQSTCVLTLAGEKDAIAGDIDKDSDLDVVVAREYADSFSVGL